MATHVTFTDKDIYIGANMDSLSSQSAYMMLPIFLLQKRTLMPVIE